MGLRIRLARWLNGDAPTPLAPSASVAGDQHSWRDVYAVVAKLEARVEKLELDRPAFVTALEEMAERCHDVLDAAESKRARIAAKESRLKKREQEQDGLGELPLSREDMKNEVRRMHTPSWRR